MPLAFIAAAFFFLVFPEMDLWVSTWFYRPTEGFFLRDSLWARLFYKGSPILVNIWMIILTAMVMLSFRQQYRRLRRPALFLLTVILLGPGLVVNILKDHWDRARPGHVVEFGGDRQFTPAWVISDQCEDNCSFVSGHASGAFALMALAWVVPLRRRFWLVTGVLWGTHMGVVRILQGGHFLSDVVFAGMIVYFTADLLARWVFYRDRSA